MQAQLRGLSGRIIQRMGGQQHFPDGGFGGVEMRRAVDQQAQRCALRHGRENSERSRASSFNAAHRHRRSWATPSPRWAVAMPRRHGIALPCRQAYVNGVGPTA